MGASRHSIPEKMLPDWELTEPVLLWLRQETDIFSGMIRRLLHGRHGQENIRAVTGIGRKKPEYQTFFGIKGPGVRKNQVAAKMSLADEGPTLAALLGLDLGMTDGNVIDTFLEKE